MQFHHIKLKGPWDYLPLSRSVGLPVSPEPDHTLPPGGTVKMPASWQEILGDFRGIVRFSRKFNRPSNLVDQDTVKLNFDGVYGQAEVQLNQQVIGRIAGASSKDPYTECTAAAQFDVSRLLQPNNSLEVTIEWNGPADEGGGLCGVVSLSIASQNENW